MSGRAPRSEYWWFSLLYVSVAVVLVGTSFAAGIPLLSALLLPLVVPMLAVSIRRLHDTSRSGWWMLTSLIPVVGPIFYLAVMTLDSAHGPNEYGPPPRSTPAPSS